MSHPLYKFGKTKASRDKRNLSLKSVLLSTPVLPAEYSFDTAHPGVPLRMFKNDVYGCCVLAERAHQTMRFEFAETGKVPQITDTDVTREYFKETGGIDSGLNMLASLKAWRTGWKAAGRKYKITAFAEIDRTSRDQVRHAIYADVGASIGVALPASAMAEFDAGKPWSKTTGRGLDGHCIYLVGYTKQGPVCITWGQRQQMTWAWFRKYCDEAYAVFDSLDTVKIKKLIHTDAVLRHLAKVAA